jgi:hypothetical protein
MPLPRVAQRLQHSTAWHTFALVLPSAETGCGRSPCGMCGKRRIGIAQRGMTPGEARCRRAKQNRDAARTLLSTRFLSGSSSRPASCPAAQAAVLGVSGAEHALWGLACTPLLRLALAAVTPALTLRVASHHSEIWRITSCRALELPRSFALPPLLSSGQINVCFIKERS